MNTNKLVMAPDEEIKSLWRYIGRSVDRVLVCLDGLSEDDLNWRPLDSANSRQLQHSVSSHLARLPSGALDQEYEHPRRGRITGRDLLITIARHMAEHVGHAELTRDLLFTARGRELPKRDF